MTELIKPAWHGTLEFLAGIVDKSRARELIEEVTRNYFERKSTDTKKISIKILSEMDLGLRITLDLNLSEKRRLSYLLDEVSHLINPSYFSTFSKKSQDFMLKYTHQTMPDLKRSRSKARLVIPLTALSCILGGAGLWYYFESSKKEDVIIRLDKENLDSCEEHYFRGNHEFAQKCLTEIMHNSNEDKRKKMYQRLLNISLSQAEYGGVEKLVNELTRGEFSSSKVFYHEWGQVFLYQRDYNNALKLFFKAEKSRKDTPADICWTWQEMGNVYLRMGEYNKAEEYYGKASKAYEKINPEVREFLGWHYQKLAYLSFLNGRNKDAEAYLEQSRHIFTEEREDKVGLAWTLHHQLLYCVSTNQNCEDLGKRALKLFEELRSPEGIIWTNYQLARGILRNAPAARTALKGQPNVIAPKGYFLPLERIDEAKQYLAKSLEEELKLNLPEGLANVYGLMGEAELYSFNYNAAGANIQLSFDYIISSNYEQKGNFKDSVMIIRHNLRLLEQIPEHSVNIGRYQQELNRIKSVIGTKKFELLISELDRFGVIS